MIAIIPDMSHSIKIFTFTICILIVIICLIMLYRNGLIYKYRKRALRVASRKADKAIDNGECKVMRFYDQYDVFGSYDDMFYNRLLKWKYEDFYPNWN